MMGSTLKPPPEDPAPIPREEIRIPLAIARGHLEKVNVHDLLEHLQDCKAEVERRVALQRQQEDS